MSLRKKQQVTERERQSQYGSHRGRGRRGRQIQAYADQQNAKVWTYVFVVTLCVIVWASTLTSWIILGEGGALVVLGGRSKILMRSRRLNESSPLQAEIRALKDELVKEEKKKRLY